ncbi:Probable metal-nicotianamine transporter YSL7 [Linum perenne]
MAIERNPDDGINNGGRPEDDDNYYPVETEEDDDNNKTSMRKRMAGKTVSSSSSFELEQESVEKIFEAKEVPPWQNQLTVRAFVVSFVLGVLFTFIVMKLNLTTGIIPSLNVSAGLLGFFFVKTWTKMLQKSGMLRQPFTRQENTVIQTCVVATSGIAFSGGFGSYLFGMSEVVAKQSTEANNAQNIKEPSLGWMIGFLFVVSFLGLFSVVPLRKIMVIDFKLSYPSGTATAHLINSFHTPQGAKLAKKQVRALGKFFSFSFLWGFFQWFFTAGDGCGFVNFPTFGLQAFEHKRGNWYSAELPQSSLSGLQGYKIFIAIAMILGDGVYNFAKDFKTGYMTLASPRSMFISQVIGTAMGCVIAPCVFWLFYKAFHDLGQPGSEYPAPYALVYRNMSILGVEGFSALPKHCLMLCCIFFFAAMAINGIRDLVGTKWAKYIPLPMAMAIPFYLGGYFAIDMCVGSLILFVWGKVNKEKADAFGPAVASGLICGDGIWTLPSSVLALAGVNPPICMKFLSRKANTRVDAFLGS